MNVKGLTHAKKVVKTHRENIMSNMIIIFHKKVSITYSKPLEYHGGT